MKSSAMFGAEDLKNWENFQELGWKCLKNSKNS